MHRALILIRSLSVRFFSTASSGRRKKREENESRRGGGQYRYFRGECVRPPARRARRRGRLWGRGMIGMQSLLAAAPQSEGSFDRPGQQHENKARARNLKRRGLRLAGSWESPIGMRTRNYFVWFVTFRFECE